jgi:hypothetical protein
MRFTVRELAYIGVFGALWGTVETGLGAVLHVANVPFSGALLSACGITIALVGRLFVPRAPSVLLIGLVTAFIKMLSLGGIVINPMIGILMESLLAEAALMAVPFPRAAFLAAGGVAVAWSLVHPLFTQGLLAGRGIVAAYRLVLETASAVTGIEPSAVTVLVLILVAGHLALGVAAGHIAWNSGRAVRARVGRPDILLADNSPGQHAGSRRRADTGRRAGR